MTLEEFQKADLPRLRHVTLREGGLSNVTALAYYFRSPDRLDADFWRTEYAFLKTFETQGLMPAALVVNQATPLIADFCDSHRIRLQHVDTLIPGQIKTLAIDLVQNLHARFQTEYVLTIQDDGFPLRAGLAEFVGKYDYIGAPWVHHHTYYDLYPYRYCVGNGGFSLRSRRLCCEASALYRRYFKWMPYWWYLLGDDTFYCKTLRFWFPFYRHRFAWATPSAASCFSIEHNLDFLEDGVLPLGMHGEVGFANYRKLQGEGGPSD